MRLPGLGLSRHIGSPSDIKVRYESDHLLDGPVVVGPEVNAEVEVVRVLENRQGTPSRQAKKKAPGGPGPVRWRKR
jgi:hypothetical protein